MRIQELMTEDVLSVSPEEPAEGAWQTMRLHRIHHLVVIENRQVVGVVSERDLGGPKGAALRRGAGCGS